MIREIIAVVFVVVAAMLGLTLLQLGAVDLSWVTWGVISEVLKTGVTVGGFGLAIMAYRKWRRPDDARLRSQTAQTILRQLRQTALGVQEARVQGMITIISAGNEPTIEDKMDELRTIAATPREPRIAAVDVALRGLEQYQEEVDELYKNTAAPMLMKEICELIEETKKSYRLVSLTIRTEK